MIHTICLPCNHGILCELFENVTLKMSLASVLGTVSCTLYARSATITTPLCDRYEYCTAFVFWLLCMLQFRQMCILLKYMLNTENSWRRIDTGKHGSHPEEAINTRNNLERTGTVTQSHPEEAIQRVMGLWHNSTWFWVCLNLHLIVSIGNVYIAKCLRCANRKIMQH